MTVSDTGSGMPREVIDRAFEPFFTTKQPGRGTGLGLASIHGFVKQSGGNATIYSEPGQGTSVNLYLPRFAGQDVRTTDRAADYMPLSAGELVLVVEDSPELRMLTVDRLERLGYRVIEADGGPAALAVLETGAAIDLIFSDVIMPGGFTGYQIAARAREFFPGMKVLLTSGYDSQQGAATEFKVLRKPYKQMELARALRDVLEAA